VYTGGTWDALDQLAAIRGDKARANPLVYEVMETQSGMALDPPCVIAPPAVEVGDRTRHHIAMRLLPFLFVLYIANYLDRANLAYAALGMSRDLGFSDRVWAWASSSSATLRCRFPAPFWSSAGAPGG
jgi:hypothetical protein